MKRRGCSPGPTDRPTIDALGALDAVECIDMSSADYQTALGAATGVILADEFAPGLLGSAREVLAAIAAGKMPRLRRVIMISHIGVTRRWGSHLAPLS